jgi:hypothetical protein
MLGLDVLGLDMLGILTAESLTWLGPNWACQEAALGNAPILPRGNDFQKRYPREASPADVPLTQLDSRIAA